MLCWPHRRIELPSGTPSWARRQPRQERFVETLSDIELRVLGVLLEKAVTTPDQYPLSLNSIVSGCNQKSSRDPVLSLEQGEVQHGLRLLEDKLLVSTDPNRRGRVEKYLQRFCKPPFGVFDFDNAQYAVLTVLMLRGRATPGELRTRTDRMHKFASNEAVVETLQQLANWETEPMVVELPREPNRRDNAWAHLFGESEAQHPAQAPAETPAVNTGNESERLAALEARVATLEATLSELQATRGDQA